MAISKVKKPMPSAPIPGENFTSDWENYPWHRPPDIDNMDDAIDYVARTLTETDEGFQYMAYLKTGVTVAGVTDMILTLGIADGKWSIDFAILIAGPVARLVTIMAKGYKIDYNMGIDTKRDFVTSEELKAQLELTDENRKAMEEEMAQVKEGTEVVEAPVSEEGGLMAMAPEEEQNAMLGYGEENDEQPTIEEEEQV